MIRLGTFYSVIRIHNGPAFSPKYEFFPLLCYLYILDNKNILAGPLWSSICNNVMYKMLDLTKSIIKWWKEEKSTSSRMHLVIRTLNNRDCGIYIYELYECTLGCKVVKLILYLLPLLQPVTRKSGQGRKKMNRREANIVLYSFPYSITQK